MGVGYVSEGPPQPPQTLASSVINGPSGSCGTTRAWSRWSGSSTLTRRLCAFAVLEFGSGEPVLFVHGTAGAGRERRGAQGSGRPRSSVDREARRSRRGPQRAVVGRKLKPVQLVSEQ